MPTASQGEETAADCSRLSVRPGALCAGCYTHTEQTQGSALRWANKRKEEWIALVLVHVGTESSAQG